MSLSLTASHSILDVGSHPKDRLGGVFWPTRQSLIHQHQDHLHVLPQQGRVVAVLRRSSQRPDVLQGFDGIDGRLFIPLSG
ncbi:hypothetical protein Nwi_1342 [Nitrobacter winogradskyi Nb-255]|uniref:Uncharacterized protein n=1 Tax=Nitrobacter winogradskyi (strain ATCC 25391 / DSM 10237 / CIP 104748 / NCIMB 11846 / Nb-255) TaxID=323098 RepID=Q3SSY8_NITWN|nr:hypothetical protein Nwi_1342 [Nitrobacter winogradskyi Nb-255]